MNPLRELEACGQSPWLDYVKRSLIESGELARMIVEDGVRGVTSNPAIFEKAIGHSDEYDASLAAFQKEADHGISAIYDHLAMADIRAGADVLRPVYDETGGRDGYISLECSPYLADDTEATVEEARRLWKAVDRPNLMVKVPATPAGIPAIRTLIGEGININVTLLFAVSAYEQVAEAYIAGLEDLARRGGDVSRVGSVASFFVSRIDNVVDKKLAEKGEAGKRLLGRIAIANAKNAYASYKRLFSGPRWEALAAKGAKTQRVLWASTSTKNPAYRDVMYVEELIGRDTVNTLPPATMDAFRDHGVVKPDAVEQGLDEARAQLAELERLGISLDEVTRELVVDGVRQFADAFDQLLGAVARRRRTLFEGDRATLEIRPGSDAFAKAWAAEMEAWRRDGRIRRLWRGDASLWTGEDEDRWLGWLHIVEHELADLPRLDAFAREVRERGYTDVVLLGMGGSSLGPEVLAQTFGHIPGWPRFHMLDSTDPAQVRAVEASLEDITRTLFIVSSKSGSTLEPNIFLAYFHDRAEAALGAGKAGANFVAVTDPGSAMEARAKELGFAHVFHGIKEIGGRYSVLSKFGTVPAAAIGLDLRRFLETTQRMVRSCADDVPPAENPGVQLGTALGVAARDFGRDKVTILAGPGIAALGAWLEQLLAESTGKQGRGLIPVDGEPLAPPDRYGRDRFFALVELEGSADEERRALADALERAGHPVARITVKGPAHIGEEFFRWEIATAVAGSVLGINPFDQPDVEASKVKTRALVSAYEKEGRFPAEEPVFRENGIALYADPRNAGELGQHNTLSGWLKSHFGRAREGDYAAFLAYIQQNRAHEEALQRMRARVLETRRVATCLGFGPRFLHSTGQAYKGGPASGVFLQITCDDEQDLRVPGTAYGFSEVKTAQARGDLEVLTERGRRALRVHLAEVDAGLAELARAVDQALS